jgi:predicted metal-dependent RNase
MNQKNTIRLRFLGAIGTVTGSCTMMEYYSASEDKKRYFLIDAGTFQNEGHEQEDNRTNVLKYYAKKIEAIFITHAHLDHIGLLPNIIQYGFRGKIYCTQATHKLMMTMLTHTDDKEINENLLNRIVFIDVDASHGENGAREFGDIRIPIAYDLVLGCLRTSHVLGSCAFYFQWTEKVYPRDENISNKEKELKNLHFSGDIGPVSKEVKANIIFKDHQTPYWWDEKDICIVMESTYGDRIRNKEDIFNKKMEKLEKIIDSVNPTRGSIIIPAFALDRSQQILTDLFLIYQKKRKELLPQGEIDYNWAALINNFYKNEKCIELPNKVAILLGKDKGLIRKELIETIKNICSEYDNLTEISFNEINEECQNKIVKIFKEKVIPKPDKIQKIIDSQYGFTVSSPLIGKVNKIYINHLTDELFSHKKGERKFEYISKDFIDKLNIWEKEDISKQKETLKKILPKFLKEDSSKDAENNEKIVVTASGMCDEGKAITLLGKYFRDENAILILTGYQAKDTNGFLLKKLLDGQYEEEEKKSIGIKLSNERFILADIKCRIENMSEYYSGHADQEQLLDYVTPFYKYDNPGKVTVLLNHGSDDSRNELKTKIENRNEKTKVILPEINKWIDIVSLEVSDPDNDMESIEENTQFVFTQVGGIHIYYPLKYETEKIQSIIDYINRL